MDRRCVLRSKKLFAGLTLGALFMLTALAWLGRPQFSVWYSVYRLINAEETDQQTCVERVARLDVAAMPKLIGCLRRADMRSCARARMGLLELVQRWPPGDDRRAQLASCLAESFADLSGPGQQAALQIQGVLLHSSQAGGPTRELVLALTGTLHEASRAADGEVHARALKLASRLIDHSGQAESVHSKEIGLFGEPDLLSACRELTRTCLADEAAANRVQAICLALQPAVGLLEALIPMLNDSAPEVRRAAMRAVGRSATAMNTDDLLRWLHDPDPEVRRLCEEALRSRGLRDDHVKLGRLMTDSRPRVRLQVLDLLRQANDLEPGIWLRHLSHDPAPAVRAAAVRAAKEQGIGTLADRLDQMAQNDPCPSVRQLTQYYITSQKTGSNGPPR